MEISTLRENEQFCHSEEINSTNLPTSRNRSVSRSSSNSEEKGLTNQKRRDSTRASGKGSDAVGVRDRRNSIGKDLKHPNLDRPSVKVRVSGPSARP